MQANAYVLQTIHYAACVESHMLCLLQHTTLQCTTYNLLTVHAASPQLVPTYIMINLFTPHSIFTECLAAGTLLPSISHLLYLQPSRHSVTVSGNGHLLVSQCCPVSLMCQSNTIIANYMCLAECEQRAPVYNRGVFEAGKYK